MSPDPLADVDPTAPVGTVLRRVVDGEPVAVVHAAAGWVLVPDRCTHAACPLSRDGEVLDDGAVLACICHGSEFDLTTGEVLLGPARSPLAVTALSVVDGALRRP